MQVVINARSFSLVTAGFVQSSRSRSLTVELSRSIRCLMVYLISLAHKFYILADDEDIKFYNQGFFCKLSPIFHDVSLFHGVKSTMTFSRREM